MPTDLRIYKYPFPDFTGNQFDVLLPIGAKVLCVQVQNLKPCIWALVDTDAAHEPRRFTFYGTGHQCDENPDDYVGTFQMQDGTYVFHLFEPSATKERQEVEA